MISTNAYLHTFFIKAVQYGTAFTVDIGGQEFLITARHLIDPQAAHFDLQLFFKDKWHTLDVEVVGCGTGDIDIAVLRYRRRLVESAARFSATKGGYHLGQDVYFLGFPFKMWGDFGPIMDGLPIAFVKKGTLSFVTAGETREFYVDAINNEGFSGGPLIFYPPDDPHDVRVIAVVSKFRTASERVTTDQGETTPYQISYNTGFLVAYGMTHAFEIVERATSVS